MRANKPDGGPVSQPPSPSPQPVTSIGSLFQAFTGTVRKVFQTLTPVLSRVNYAASMAKAAGRNPQVIWVGTLNPGEVDTPEGQALIAKQERVLNLLAQLLVTSLANSDPEKAKESQVIISQINAILLNEEATVADQEAYDLGAAAAAAESKYGGGTAQKPQLPPPGGGDWVQSNGEWVHPELARARAAQSLAGARAVEARARSDEATAQVAVYAADPEYSAAVAGANRTLSKTLAPEDLTIEIKSTKSLEQAQADLRSAQDIAGKATQSRQKREQAESALLDALKDKNKVQGAQDPNGATVRPMDSSESNGVSGRKVAYDDKAARAGFTEYGRLSAEADLLDAEIGVSVAQQLVGAAEEGTPKHDEALQTLGLATDQLDRARANRDVAVHANDLAKADRDLARVQVRAAPIEDDALNTLRAKSPFLFQPEGFRSGNINTGALQSVTVDQNPKDGQLHATFRYEHKEVDVPLTFAPGSTNIQRSKHERELDLAWSDVAGCGPNGLLSAQQRKKAAEQAYTSSTVKQLEVNIKLTGKAAQQLETMLGKALGEHEPAIPVGGPGEAAPYPEAVKAMMNGQEVWVHPDVAKFLAALDATREIEQDLKRRHVYAAAWHDFTVFSASQPLKLLNEDSAEYQGKLLKAYYDGRRDQATHQIELNYGAMAQQTTGDGKALFGAEHLLGGRDLKSALQRAGAAPEEIGKMAGKIREIGGDEARVSFVPFQYIDDSAGSQQMLFAIVRDSDGIEHVVDGRGSKYALEGRTPENIRSFIEAYQNDNKLSKNGTIVVPKNLSFVAKDDKVATEAHQAHVLTALEEVIDPIANGVATIAPLLMLIPGVNVVAAPLAIIAGGYAAGRQLENLGRDFYRGREITPGRLFTEVLSAGSAVLPATASASRMIGLRQAGLGRFAALRTSIGATYGRTPYHQRASEIMRGASGGALGLARSLDLASVVTGAPLLVLSAFDMAALAGDPGATSLMDLMGYASGVHGTVSGLYAHAGQGQATSRIRTRRPRHAAPWTTPPHPALGMAAQPGSLGRTNAARGDGSQGTTLAAEPALASVGSRNAGGISDHLAASNARPADPVLSDRAPATRAAPTVLPTAADAVTAGQIINSSSAVHGDTGGGGADEQARPGRAAEGGAAPASRVGATSGDRGATPVMADTANTVPAADALMASQIVDAGGVMDGDTNGGPQEQQAHPGRPAENGTVNGPRQTDAGDRDPMPLWRRARQSPDGLALPADRRAAMNAGGDVPPSGWRDVGPWKWQEGAPDVRISVLGRLRVNSGSVSDAIAKAYDSQMDSSPVGSPTWRSYSAGLGTRSNVRAVGAAMGEGPGAVRDALQSAAGVSIRPNEHRNVTTAQLGLPASHQVAFQFKGADLIRAGEELIFDDPSQSPFELLPKAGRVVSGSKSENPNSERHVVEIVYGLSPRSHSVTLRPGETDVFGAPASNAAGFVRFERGVPYKKVMLEDKLYLHPAWVSLLPAPLRHLIPRISLERRHEVTMDATFHEDFTVSREFLGLNQAVLGKLRLRTQVVVNNPDDAAALAAAPSVEKLQELLAKGAIDPDQRLTYVRGSSSGLRQSAVPGLPLKETIVDLAGNTRRVWSPGSSRLEVIINDQFRPRRSFNLDRILLARTSDTFSHYVPSDGAIFWGMFGDRHDVAMTTIRNLAWSLPPLRIGIPGLNWLHAPLVVTGEVRLFHKTKLPATASSVASERTTSWEFTRADGLVLAVEGPRWLRRITNRAETGRIAALPRGGKEALGKWLDRLEHDAAPSQKEAIADFRRTVLPALKDETFLSPEQASTLCDFIAGQAQPKAGAPLDGAVALRPGAFEPPLVSWYETHGVTVEVPRNDPMPLWNAARQNLDTLRAGRGNADAGEPSSRAALPPREIPDALKPHLWSMGSSHALDVEPGPGSLRQLNDGTATAPEDMIARIRSRLEQEANRPSPGDLSAGGQPPGGPNQQLIAKGRGLVGQSTDPKVDGSLIQVLDYLGRAPDTAPGYRQAITDLDRLVRQIETPAQGLPDSQLRGALTRANSYRLNRAANSAAEWPLTMSLGPLTAKPAAAQQSTGAASQSTAATTTPAAQPHVGQGAIANPVSTDLVAEARQSPEITARPDYAGDDSDLRNSFVRKANTYGRGRSSKRKWPEPDAAMKAQTAYLATARSPDDHALKNRPLRQKLREYATGEVPYLLGAQDLMAVRYIEGPVSPDRIMGGGTSHQPLDLLEFTLHSTFDGAREAVQQRPAPARKKGGRHVPPGGYVYRLVGPKDVLAEAVATGSIDPKLVEGGLRVFGDGSVYPFSVVNRDATYAPKPGETFVKPTAPPKLRDKLRVAFTNLGYVVGAAFGTYMTARIGTGSHIGARDLMASLSIYAWLFRGSVAGIRQGAKIRLQKRQDDAAQASGIAHDAFKPGEALLDQINRQVTGARGRRLGIAKPDRERYAAAIETAQQAVAKGDAPEPDTMKVVREAVVDMATQPLLGPRGAIHRVKNKSEVENAAAELHQDPTQSAPWQTIADAHLDILMRRVTGWRGAVWGHSRADRMNYLLAYETLRTNRLDAEAMQVLAAAPGRLISPNTPTGRLLEFARYASFSISNVNTSRLVTNPFADPGQYSYLGALGSYGGAASLASNSASAVFLFGNLPGVVGTASKRGAGSADFNAAKNAAEELDAAAPASAAPATPGQTQSPAPAQSGAGATGKTSKPHPTYASTNRGGKIIGPVRRFLVGIGDPSAVRHDGQLPDGPPAADGTQNYKPMYKPSLIQRLGQYASAGDAFGMVPFFITDNIHAVNAFAAGQPVVGAIELLKVAADWYVFRGAQKDYVDEYRSNRGMGPIVWHSRVTDMFNAPLNGAERDPSSVDKPWLRHGLPPLVLLGSAVAVRVGLSLAFPWEQPAEEGPQQGPVDVHPVDPTQLPTLGPVQIPAPPPPDPRGPYQPIANLRDGARQEPAGSTVRADRSSTRFVTMQEKPDRAAIQ